MARKVITIFGGGGFVGRYIARRYARLGYEVRVAVRRPNQALYVRTYGEVGQVNPIQANIRDEASMRRVIEGADIVVNAVGVLYEDGFQDFDDVHNEACRHMARICTEESVKQFVHISAIGADEDGPSKYARSKAEGEAGILQEYPSALIVRPSLIFGGENDFFNRFAKMARWSWVMPVVEGKTKFQPVYVDDVAEFVESALTQGWSGVFELGGSEVMSMREIIEYVLGATRRNRIIIPMPRFMALIMAWALSIVQLLTFRLIKNHVLTPDQLKQLSVDNVVTGQDGLKKAKIVAEKYVPIMEPYMESYRPRGEFENLIKAKI